MKSYEDYVLRAREILNKLECYQAHIAQMGLEVCQIRHGGKSNGFYTIKDFAHDIGMSSKTLSNWISIYRDVLTKIGVNNPTPEQWAAASKTCNYLKTQRTEINREEGKPGTRNAFKKKVPSGSIKKIFDEIAGGEGETIKLERIYSQVLHSRSVLLAMDLSKVDSLKLARVMEWLDECSDHINNHLTASRAKKAC
jgi:hypothetical protein